jgi:Predicted transcriptional regulator
MAFVLKNLVWYLYGYCRLRNDMRTFKISRIEKLAVTENTFVRRDLNDFPIWTLDFNDDYETVNLLLGVKPEARYDVEEWLGIECVVPSKNVAYPYTASAAVRFDSNLVPRLLAFCDNVKILSPSTLRDAVKNAANAIAVSYDE